MRRFLCVLAILAAAPALGCDAGLEPEPLCAPNLVGVCGTLHFRGTIPDSTDNVFIAAYASFPLTCNDLIDNRQPFIPGSVPYTDSIAAYSVPLPPGQYQWIVAVWKKIGPLTLSPADTAVLRVAGYYHDPLDTTLARVATVPSGGSVGDIDFVVDFDNLRRATDFVSCTL